MTTYSQHNFDETTHWSLLLSNSRRLSRFSFPDIFTKLQMMLSYATQNEIKYFRTTIMNIPHEYSHAYPLPLRPHVLTGTAPSKVQQKW